MEPEIIIKKMVGECSSSVTDMTDSNVTLCRYVIKLSCSRKVLAAMQWGLNQNVMFVKDKNKVKVK